MSARWHSAESTDGREGVRALKGTLTGEGHEKKMRCPLARAMLARMDGYEQGYNLGRWQDAVNEER